MKGKYYYRIINTVITATGTLLCIVSGFIPAPYGLLSDGTISLIQSLTGSQKAERFIVPVLLFIAATVIVAAGRYKLGSLIAVLGGSCIFALTDLSYIQSSMAFTGTLLNEFGIVIALSGVLLHAIGTPESKSLKAKSSKKTLDPFLEIKPGPEPETEVLGIRTGLQEEPESGAVVRSVQTGLQEKPELGAEVSSVQTGLQEEPESEAAVLGLRTGLPEETESANEPQKDNAPAEVAPAADSVKYTQVLWRAAIILLQSLHLIKYL